VATYQVTLAKAAPILWLHAQDLTIARATVGGKEARAVTAPGGFLGLLPQAPIPAGEATVVIAFSGALDRVRSRALYAVAEGERWYAYTFFQPEDARRAFPCFDEPRFKIPWRLVLDVPEGNLALANAPLAAERAEGGRRRFEFAVSRPLPSELVAFVVGPFDLVDGGTGGAARVPIRFVVPKGRGAEARYAVEATPRIFAALEAVIGRPYPYEKCDVAVVPRFWGTMEHPGLVALGQPLTLIPPAEETRVRKEAYASIAIHELAHHWYGDQVTPAWWDDLWLNESFATWEDANVTEKFEPAWRELAEGRWTRRAAGLEADAVPSAKRLREPVTSRDEIDGAFDNGITYYKGAALITAYEAFVGPDRWRAAVQDHLDARAHGVATSDDLLAALSARAGPEVAASLRGFLDQRGVPLLQASVACGPAGATVTLRQERFLSTGPRDRATRWVTPICLRGGAGKEEATVCGLVHGPKGTLTLPICPDWLTTNAGGTGYYLSALAPGQAARLWPHLDGAEQLALVTDAALLARRGDVPLEDALGLIEPLAQDPDRLHVQAALQLEALLGPRELGAQDYLRYQELLRRTYGERARRLGWLPRPDDDDEARALRSRLLPLVAGPGAEAVLAGEALALATRWLADRRQVPSETAWDALGVAARHGDRTLFDLIVAEVARSTDRADRERLYGALGQFQDPALSQAALALAVDEASDLRDTQGILGVALSQRATRAGAWAFVRSHWATIAKRLRDDEASWLVQEVAAVACEPRARAEVAAFLGPRAKAFDGASRALATGLEQADACIASRARHGAAVARFLARR
jgi:aminopeptidase N